GHRADGVGAVRPGIRRRRARLDGGARAGDDRPVGGGKPVRRAGRVAARPRGGLPAAGAPARHAHPAGRRPRGDPGTRRPRVAGGLMARPDARLRRRVRGRGHPGVRVPDGGLTVAVAAGERIMARATGRSAERVLGWCALVAMSVSVIMSLVVAPADAEQGNVQRLMYVHVPSAWLAYL